MSRGALAALLPRKQMVQALPRLLSRLAQSNNSHQGIVLTCSSCFGQPGATGGSLWTTRLSTLRSRLLIVVPGEAEVAPTHCVAASEPGFRCPGLACGLGVGVAEIQPPA
ncbi:unnamed protein product [Rangifer tarandus platyrhynchus]|uniref:Uncharacterized protein n=1 Tax=Rangifer tarandus platyrhynchus TaxID=3082113 RepID=A0AC60A6U1_RANTA